MSQNHDDFPANHDDGRCWARTSDLRLVEAEPDHFDSPYQSVPAHISPGNPDKQTYVTLDLSVRGMTDETFWSALSVLRRRPR